MIEPAVPVFTTVCLFNVPCIGGWAKGKKAPLGVGYRNENVEILGSNPAFINHSFFCEDRKMPPNQEVVKCSHSEVQLIATGWLIKHTLSSPVTYLNQPGSLLVICCTLYLTKEFSKLITLVSGSADVDLNSIHFYATLSNPHARSVVPLFVCSHNVNLQSTVQIQGMTVHHTLWNKIFKSL